MKVSNMTSPKTGNPVTNQFTIEHEGVVYFQSYDSVIAKIEDGIVTLDGCYWDYSRTTSKYRNEFLGETASETRKKIKSGEYKLANLN